MEQQIANRSAIGTWVGTLRAPLALGLAALLAVQVLAAILLGWEGRGTLAPTAADAVLLPFDPKAVTSLRIEGGDQTVTLARGDQGWLIADLSDFPAEGTKVEALLDRLAGLKRPLPVATSAEALTRHKVADQGFERKVTLESGDKAVATLILGDSPGFKRQFARPAGETVVYDLDLPLHEVSNRRDDWLVRDSLRVDQDQITAIAAADWRLTKGADGWQLEGSDAKPDSATVINLLGRLGNLGYRGVLGTEDKPEYNQANPTLDLRLQLADGGARAYRIAKTQDGRDFVLKAADRPWYFKLSEFDLEGLLDLNRDKLLGLAPAAATPGPDGGASDSDQETGGQAPGESPGEGGKLP